MGDRLKGKIAIVTGAGCIGPGWGNGRASAVRFAEEGAQVFAVDRDLASVRETVERAGEAGKALHLHQCDMTGPVALPEEAWQQQIALNLTSVYLGCKHAIPAMEKQGGGSIINVASTSGIRWTGSAQVGSTIGVCNCPGTIEFTRMPLPANSTAPEAKLAGQRAGGDVELLLKQRLERIPMGFAGDGRDTANVALFLASDESRWVTGTEIVVDGGMSARCD